MRFVDRLRLPFLDQPQLDIVVLAIITFHIYNILVQECRYIIVPNDIILFIEELELSSTSIIKLVNIRESSHEEAILISKTNE